MEYIQDFDSKFIKVELIGEGASSKIYIYLDKCTNTRVAVKEFVTVSIYPFLRELATYAVLDSSFPSCKGYSINPYRIIVDLYDNTIKNRNLKTYDDIMNVFKQLLTQVHYLHSRGFAHRDIKSANIVYKDNKVTLIDFGSTRRMVRLPEINSATTEVTTVWWSAPELYEAKKGSWKYSQAIDIWSLGMTFIELLGIQLPSAMPNATMESCYNALKEFYKKYDDEVNNSDEYKLKMEEILKSCHIQTYDPEKQEKIKRNVDDKYRTYIIYSKYLHRKLVSEPLKLTDDQACTIINAISMMLTWDPWNRQSAYDLLYFLFKTPVPDMTTYSMISGLEFKCNRIVKYPLYNEIIYNNVREGVSNTYVPEMKRSHDLYKRLRIICKRMKLCPETMMIAVRILDELQSLNYKINHITPWAIVSISLQYIENKNYPYTTIADYSRRFTHKDLENEINSILTLPIFKLFTEYTPLDAACEICNELGLDVKVVIPKLLKRCMDVRSPQSYLQIAIDSCK